MWCSPLYRATYGSIYCDTYIYMYISLIVYVRLLGVQQKPVKGVFDSDGGDFFHC